MKKFFVFVILIVVLAGVGVYQYLDVLAKNAIEKYASEALGVQVRVKDVSIDLVKAQYKINGLTIANPSGFTSPYLFDISELETKIDYRSLFKDVLYIYYIKVENPKVAYEIAAAGDNIKALRKSTKATSSGVSGTADAGHKVIIEKFFFNKGQVTAGIQKVGEKSVVLPDIYIQNIGKDQNGVSVQNASEQILRELSKVISQVNIKSLLNNLFSKEKVDEVKDKIHSQVDKLLGGVVK